MNIKDIAKIDTPIKLVAASLIFIVLTLGTILKFSKLGPTLTVIIIIGLVFCLLVLVIAAYKIATKSSPPPAIPETPVLNKYEVFISAPMESIDDPIEYERMRRWVLGVHDALERLKYTVFYAGKHLADRDEFEDPAEAVKEDLKAVNESKNFMMIYPHKIATSGLVELGYALAKNKRIWILIKDENDLPYLLKKLDAAYSNVSITKYNNDDHFMNLLEASHQDNLKST